MKNLSLGALGLATFLLCGCASKRIVVSPARQNRPATTKHSSVKKNSLDVVGIPDAKTSVNLLELKKNLNSPKIYLDLIENKLSLNELELAAGDVDFISIKPQLLLKIGKIYQKNNEPDRAAEYFRSVSTLYAQTEFATQATVLLSTVQMTNEVDSKVIGAVLPLTGKNASLGQHALNSLRMGLELNKPDSKFRLALFDSQSNPELASAGVDKLVKEDKAIVVLGGFTSKEAVAMANSAELLSTPYIAFSQKSGLTNIGDYVFRNSMTPEMQVDKLVQFATEKLSAKKFAILFPNDSYGVEFSNVFWDHVLARGGEITAAQTYDPKETDFSEVVQKLVGTFYAEARQEEYAARRLELKTKKTDSTKKTNSREHLSEENILPPILDFDVLFVPDNSRALGQVLAFMKYNDASDMNYLGTNIWNAADLPKRAANEDAGIYFVDALDVSQGASQDSSFFKNYLAEFNEEPTLVEIQVFEAAKIVKEQILAGASSREALAGGLRSLGPTAGVTGELRMSKQREIERPIHVLTLDDGLIKKVE